MRGYWKVFAVRRQGQCRSFGAHADYFHFRTGTREDCNREDMHQMLWQRRMPDVQGIEEIRVRQSASR